MNIVEVDGRQHSHMFHEMARSLYKGDPHWVCPLDVEIEQIFDPRKNKLFQRGAAIRWVLQDDRGRLTGRIAAFYNEEKANKHDQPTGGIGFFECVNDQAAANLLFDTARSWLQQRGMEAMDGSIVFGENINHWGVLVEGFGQPVYGMPYHFPYYKDLFANYGFETYFEQLSFLKDLSEPFPARAQQFAQHIRDKGQFRFEHFSFAKKEKFVQDIVFIYNKVWEAFHEDYTPLEYADMEMMVEDAKPVLNEEFVWFVYDTENNDQPVAMVIVFPDVNQLLKKLKNGQLTLVNKLKFLYHKKTGTITRVRQLLTGVIPEYQNSGVVGALFITMVDALKRNGIKELDMSWVGDYNLNVLKIYRLMGLPMYRRHATFRYLFDREKPFKRFENQV